jgi:hypothetical protein
LVLRGEIGKLGGGGEGEEMCFGKGQLYAKRFPEFGKGVKEEGDVGVREGSRSIINDGGSVVLGTKSVVIRWLVAESTEFRMFEEFGIDLFEEYGKSKSR